MTIEEYDSRVRNGEKNLWILDGATGYSYRWTGWKRKYDPRLMVSNDPDIPLEPIDDTLVGQWIVGTKDMMHYACVPGSEGVFRSGDIIDCEVKPSQTVLTTGSSPDLLEHCRKEGFARLIVIIEKLGAIAGANFPAEV